LPHWEFKLLLNGLLRIEARQTLVLKRAIDFALAGEDAKPEFERLLVKAGYATAKPQQPAKRRVTDMKKWDAFMAGF
jgi:hypothetical protein